MDFSIGDGIMKDTDMTVEELMELVRKYDPSLGMLYASAKGASSYIDEQIANLYPTISLNAEAPFGTSPAARKWFKIFLTETEI